MGLLSRFHSKNLEDRIAAFEKKELNSTATIPSGTDYVIPANGFLSLYIKGGQELDVWIYGSNKINSIRKDYINSNSSGVHDCIYLVKGMIVNCTYTSTKGSLTFSPLS